MKDYVVSKITTNSDGNGELVLSGQLVVKNAAKIKSDLEKLKVKTSKLVCLLKDVEDFDTSMAQLLKAFSNKHEANNVDVLFDYQLNNDLTVLVTRSGIINDNNI